jgi:SNF2 family DNA or RNA helicase
MASMKVSREAQEKMYSTPSKSFIKPTGTVIVPGSTIQSKVRTVDFGFHKPKSDYWKQKSKLDRDVVLPLPRDSPIKEPISPLGKNVSSVVYGGIDHVKTFLDLQCGKVAIEELEPPKGMTLTPHVHQITGFSWMVHIEETKSVCKGGILADEMGLGKTFQVAMLYAHRPRSENRAGTLVIGPVGLISQWKKELEKYFLKSLDIALYHGPNRHSLALLDYDIVLTSYSTLASDFQNLRKIGGISEVFRLTWHRIVLDEAHEIRNFETAKALACNALTGDNKWCITGTPIQNKLEDLYSLLKFLQVCNYENFGIDR